jgi:two-component system capsular synthesis sensor histidine kinase RcsC
MNILLVDDDPTLRDLVAMVLQGEGHSVRIAPDGKDALEHFVAGQFDLVLTDVSMPRLDGIGLAKALLDIDPSQRVMLLSGDGDGIQEKLPNVDGVLQKPISFSSLKQTIRAFAGSRT